MTDRDQPAEDLDEDELAGEFPPDEPLASDDEGITGLEQLGGESVEEREDRTEPDLWRRRPEGDQPPESTVVEEASPGNDAEEGAMPVEEVTTGALSPDDDFTGDETTRDIPPERDPGPAEEAAMHPRPEPEEPEEPEPGE